MKEGWKYRLFKDVFPIKMGKTPPRGDSSSWDKKKETNNYWVSISDISQNEGNVIYDTKEYITDKAAEKIFKVKANSLLMSFKLTIGKMAFAGVDLYTNEAIIAIPENKDYNLRFLYYYLSSYDWKTLTEGNEKVKGATLNKESIGRIKLPIISLPEQQRIADRLDALSANVKALQTNYTETITLCNDLKQALLKKVFG
jgi:type I restriction enzyme S subunit